MQLAVITKRNSFVKAHEEGSFISTLGLSLQILPWQESPQAPINYGITATKRIGNAVARNRCKRRLRQVVAQVLPQVGQTGHTYIVIAKKSTLDRDFEQLKKDLKYAIKKINKNA